MSDVRLTLCATCACSDRRLRFLDAAAAQFLASLIPNMCAEVCVCWECTATLQRLRKFRDAALNVQKLLAHTEDKALIKSTTTLHISATKVEEIPPARLIKDESIDNCHLAIANSVPAVDNPVKVNTEVKLESEISNHDLFGTDDDCDSLATIKVKMKLKNVKVARNNAGSMKKVSRTPKGKRKKKTKDSYMCKVCRKEFSTRGRFEYHKESHRDKPQCEECGQTFVSKSTLWLHRKLKHAQNVERWTCGVCGKIQLTAVGHATHVAGHSRDTRLYCAICAKHFKTSSSYSKHMRSAAVHRAPGMDRYGCPDCERKFDTEERARQHRDVIHLQKNKFVCSQCSREYCTARALRVHERLKHEHVTLPRDKVCEICGKSFTTWQVLKSHRRTHTGARPYRCNTCTATFTQSGALHTHTRRVHRKDNAKA